MPSQPGKNQEEHLGERIRKQIIENPRRSQGFSPTREFSQEVLCSSTKNMFYFLNKIINFRLNKEKDDIRSAYVQLYFYHETVNSYNLEKPSYIANVIAVLHSAKKTNLGTNQNARTIQMILYNSVIYAAIKNWGTYSIEAKLANKDLPLNVRLYEQTTYWYLVHGTRYCTSGWRNHWRTR